MNRISPQDAESPLTTATTSNDPSQIEPRDGEIDGNEQPGSTLELPSRFVRVVDRKSDSMFQRIREAFQWRDLLFMLVQRDIKVRYRQTAFGIIWAVMVPLMTMIRALIPIRKRPFTKISIKIKQVTQVVLFWAVNFPTVTPLTIQIVTMKMFS